MHALQYVEQDFLFLSGLPQLRKRTRLNLPDPLLGYTKGRTDFLKRLRLLRVIQAEPAADNLLLALIQTTQNPFDLRLALVLRTFLSQRVTPMFLSTSEQFVLARTE